jgi:F-type H+-transporting ATPase subunit b
MNLDWTTLAFEAINFLILVWLLKRFFYRPVLTVLEARRAETAKTIADAEVLRREAETLKSEFQARLAGEEQERSAALARLDEEIATNRSRRQAAMEAALAVERTRREAMEARERSEREVTLERQSVAIAARFATRLLDRLAGPELNAKLADLALNELDARRTEQLEALCAALREPGLHIKVVSAYPLDGGRRAAFAQTLGKLTGRTIEPSFGEDAMLKAGVCIVAGSWVLMANLRDELNFFTGAFDHGG